MNYGRVGVQDVIAAAAALYGVPSAEMVEHGRIDYATKRRQVAMLAARRTGFSYKVIGDAFDRDPSTVIHACRRATSDPLMVEDAERVLAEVAARSAGDDNPLVHALSIVGPQETPRFSPQEHPPFAPQAEGRNVAVTHFPQGA